jgi:hypothetical protein
MSGDEFGHRVGGDLEIVRGDLGESLMERGSDVGVVFGGVIESITETARGTEVTFRSAQAQAFDLVIGADDFIRTSGESCSAMSRGSSVTWAFACASIPCRTTCIWTAWRCSTRRSVGWRRSGALATTPRPRRVSASPQRQVDLRDRPEQEEALRSVYAGIGWEVPRLLESMPKATDWYFDIAPGRHGELGARSRRPGRRRRVLRLTCVRPGLEPRRA